MNLKDYGNMLSYVTDDLEISSYINEANKKMPVQNIRFISILNA